MLRDHVKLESRRFSALQLPSSVGFAWSIIAELLAVLVVLPLLVAVFSSFISGIESSGYAYWWGDWRGWRSLGRTFHLAAVAGTVAIALGWTVTICSEHWKRPAKIIVVILCCLPLLVPSSLLASAWIASFGKAGMITTEIHRIALPINIEAYGLTAAAMVLALRYFGIAVIILFAARRSCDSVQERVFRISPIRVLIDLRLRPAFRPTIAAWLLLVLFCINDHIIPSLLLVSTYGTQVLIQFSAMLDPAGAAALAVPFAGLGIALATGAVLISRRSFTAGPVLPDIRKKSSLTSKGIKGAGIFFILTLAVLLPIAVLVCKVDSPGSLLAAADSARDQFRQTLLLAGVGAIVCTALAGVLANRWANAWRTGRVTLAPLVLLNLTVPPSLLAIGLIKLMESEPMLWVRDSSLPIFLGYLVRFLPVATLILFAIWRGESQLEICAARVHGLSKWRTFWRIILPRRRTSLLCAAAIGFVLMATELDASVMLAEAGRSTLGVRLYTLIHTAPESMVSALTLDILLLVTPVIVLLGILLFRSRSKGTN